MQFIFFGTSNFSLIVLEGLIEASYKPILVITSPDKPVGRKQIITPTPVALLAKKNDIEIYKVEHFDSSVNKKIQKFNPVLGILASYGQIVPTSMLQLFSYGILNVHPSLLPKYRGPSPIQTALLDGESKTGVSIIRLTEKMDAGPILNMQNIEITLNDNYFSLEQKTAKVGAELLSSTIRPWLRNEIKAKEKKNQLLVIQKC